MKKKMMISAAALLLIGAGAIYAFGSGAIRFGTPTEEQLDTAPHQTVESIAQKTAEELEQLSDALAQSEELVTPSSAPDVNIVQVSSPASAESKPAVAESKPASVPPAPPAKVQNAGTVFEGYTVTITDNKTPAVRAGGLDWPITKYYFFDANGNSLGSISGAAMNAIMDKYKIIGQGGSVDAPSLNGEWEFWFAEQFNTLRSLSGGVGGGNSSGTPPLASPSSKEVDMDAYAEKVIALTNTERKSNNLHSLQTESEMMELAQIRAQEIADKFSHVRPDGVRISELGYGENISQGRNTPAEAVSAWMNSSGHKANILNEKYESIGVGCFSKDGTLYWVQLFSRGSNHGGSLGNEDPATGDRANTTAYALNASELNLTAGETYQIAVENAEDVRVDWSSSKLSDGILSVDSNGNITTYHRSGMSSAKATLTVTAKIYISDRLVKTLNCKVTVTQ